MKVSGMRQMSQIVRRDDPVMLPPDASVQDACRRMRDRRIGAVLVVEAEGRLIGIFTGRDAIGRVLSDRRDPTATKLAEVMTPNPDILPPEASAIEALRLMQDGGFRHVPVVERGRVLGLVSRGDLHGPERDRLDEETRLEERIW
jgi:CBS domain-containing protein